MKKQTAINLIERVINRLPNVKNIEINEVYLFGSFTKGKEMPGDVDFYIRTNNYVKKALNSGSGDPISRISLFMRDKLHKILRKNGERVHIVHDYFPEKPLDEILNYHLFKLKDLYLLWSKSDKNDEWKDRLQSLSSGEIKHSLLNKMAIEY